MEEPTRAVSAAPALQRMALRALALTLGAYLLACLGVYASQAGLIYHPMRATAANTAGTIALPGADARVLVSVRGQPGAQAVVSSGVAVRRIIAGAGHNSISADPRYAGLLAGPP